MNLTDSTSAQVRAACASAAAAAPAYAHLPVKHRALLAGRVPFSGAPTGVALTAAQQHGGPWPSSTNAASTSVGYAALGRFLRPVALQDAPAWLIQHRGQA